MSAFSFEELRNKMKDRFRIKDFQEYHFEIESIESGYEQLFYLPETMEILITNDRKPLDFCLEIIYKYDVPRKIKITNTVHYLHLKFSKRNVLKLANTKGAVSSNPPCKVAFTGSFMNDFTLPCSIRDILSASPTPEMISLAEKAVKKAAHSFIFPFHAPEDSSDNALSALKTFFEHQSEGKISVNEKLKMKDLGATLGPATDESSPDLVCVAEITGHSRIAVALAEIKNTTTSPCEQHGQASAESANIALSHLSNGLKSHEIKVPMIYSNGNLYQFAWITLLDDSLPVSHIVSHVLDVDRDLRLIATHLANIKTHCLNTIDLLAARQNLSQSLSFNAEIVVDQSKYFIKPVESIFMRYDSDIDSLIYLWDVFARLKDIHEVVKPLGMARFSLKGKNKNISYNMIFPLVDSSFLLGVPPTQSVHEKYISNLKALVKRIHEAGVVHVDLYPSKIFWKYENDEVMIKIIDWDAATLVGDNFTPIMEERLEDQKAHGYYYKVAGAAEQKCDAWFVFILSQLNENERNRMSGYYAGDVNNVYNSAIGRLQKENQDLVEKFEAW